MEYNLGQHHIAVCQELVVAAVDAMAKGAARSGGEPLRLSDCADLSVGLKLLRRNLDCIFTNMKSFPLLMQVLNVLREENPTDPMVWGQLAEVAEHIGDSDNAAAQYSSQGHALLKYSPSGEDRTAAATAAFKHAVELAPEVCEYGYWLADAMHSTWAAGQHGVSKTKTQTGSRNSLRGLREACSQLEATLDCISSYRELHDNQAYPAQLDGQNG